MSVSTQIVNIECPYPNCDKALAAEVNANFDKMSEHQITQLKAEVRKRLLPGLRKHHKDGHPK